MFQQVYACRCPRPWKDCIMHYRRYRNIHCLWNSRFVPCAFDCDAERGLLLHTPTFSARPGVDGLETFALFFYSSPLFQGRRLTILTAKPKATLYWMQWSSVSSADRKGCFSKSPCLYSYRPRYYSSVTKTAYIKIFLHFIESIKVFCSGGGGEREMKRRQNRWRHSTSLLK